MILKDLSGMPRVGIGGSEYSNISSKTAFSMFSLYHQKMPVRIGSVVCFKADGSLIDRLYVAKITSLSKRAEGTTTIYYAFGNVVAVWWLEHSYYVKNGKEIVPYTIGEVPGNVSIYWLRGELLEKFKKEFRR
jgi:hypothetical protein